MGHSERVDVLIFGLGWTSTFLLPQLEAHNPPLSHAGTTRDGRDGSIAFNFDPNDPDAAREQLTKTPPAKTAAITFPVRGAKAAEILLEAYKQSHPSNDDVNFILLGATSIWKGDGWHDEGSPFDESDARAQAEDYLLSSLRSRAAILDLAGLYGGQRHPKSWLARVAKDKTAVKHKGALHLVHGEDVAHAIVSCIDKWSHVAGRRWILTDGWIYDWWGLFVTYGKEAREKAGDSGLQFEKWVFELMQEQGVKGLPRDKSQVGRLMDGTHFWRAVEDLPRIGRLL